MRERKGKDKGRSRWIRVFNLVLVAALGAALACFPDEARSLVERLSRLWSAPAVEGQAGASAADSGGELAASSGESAASGGEQNAPEGSTAAGDGLADEPTWPAPATPRDALPAPTVWNEEESHQYWREVGPAFVDHELEAGETWYGPLDQLGRATGAAGLIDRETMGEGIDRERGDIQELKPSGWGHNAETDMVLPDGSTYHGYFWNRSHLLAKSLGGSDQLENLVCGTRMQNIAANDRQGGMAYPETLARAWLARHPKGTVYYCATPLYVGDELVCRSVLVDIRSSDGKLNVEIEVYNAAKGHVIDYATGEFWAVG